MSNGWIRLHREIEYWKFYFKEPFTYASAWIDLLLLASHKESCFSVRGNLITVKRGELAWSEESLAKRWKWSRGKLRRYLTMLKTEQQIEQQKSFILNRIIILKYSQYQENDTADSTAERQQTVQQKDTYNNDKNEKKVKNIDQKPIAVKPQIPEISTNSEQEPKAYVIDTPLKKVVCGFKIVSGFAKDDRSWDKAHFARASKSAKILLDFFGGDYVKAVDCIEDLANELKAKGLSWTLETIVKHCANYKLQKERGEYNGKAI